MTLAADDRTYLWHPFTQQQGWHDEDAPVIERADGACLWDTNGRRYIDGVSSLWCTVHGHRHPAIDIAIRDQMDRVAHTTMLGLTHEPAIELARRLIAIAPPGMSRVFYSDSGSTATEIALKMAFQFWQQRGGAAARPTKFITLRDAYHGDTIGPVSATGFGRTGRMFACEHEDVTPDLMCLAKGITGGYLPLAATLTTERIYEGFLGEHEEFRTFFHGHTYTGNPLACAAGIASLDIFCEERTLERLRGKMELLAELLEPVAAHPAVKDVRRCGFMVGIELLEHSLPVRIGHRVTLEARRRGAIVRPLGDVVVLMPPLSISADDLRRLVEITSEAIDAATESASLREA